MQQRVANHDLVNATIEEWTSTRATEAVVDVLAAAGLAVAPVRTPRQAVRDGQVLGRGETVQLSHPMHGEIDGLYGPGLPIRFSAAETDIGPPPVLGHHTDAVLADLAGYPPDRVAELRARGVI